MAELVKIFGERNTGTNALKRLIETNSETRCCPAVVTELARPWRLLFRLSRRFRWHENAIDLAFRWQPPENVWKHSAPKAVPRWPVVVIVRDPASWLLALKRNPYNTVSEIPDGFADFLRMEWRTVGRDGIPERTLTPPELWNAKARSYFKFAGLTDCLVIHFEDFVADQVAVFERLRPVLDAPAYSVKHIHQSTKDGSKTLADYQDYYGNERWRNEIDGECLSIIDRQIDWSVASQLGYHRPCLETNQRSSWTTRLL